MFRMSAKAEIAEPEIRGPNVFQRNNDVEYSIFLTFDPEHAQSDEGLRNVLRQLLDQIIGIAASLEMDVVRLARTLRTLSKKSWPTQR